MYLVVWGGRGGGCETGEATANFAVSNNIMFTSATHTQYTTNTHIIGLVELVFRWLKRRLKTTSF